VADASANVGFPPIADLEAYRIRLTKAQDCTASVHFIVLNWRVTVC
jgi:hypothetical protein